MDSQFDFFSVSHKPTAEVNNRGSMGMIKYIFRLIKNIKAAVSKLNFYLKTTQEKQGQKSKNVLK